MGKRKKAIVVHNLKYAVLFNILPIIRMYRINDDIAVVFRDNTFAKRTEYTLAYSICSGIIQCKYSEKYRSDDDEMCSLVRNDPYNEGCVGSTGGITGYFDFTLYIASYFRKLRRYGMVH